ncbi:putative glycolipid-binding domain-containing protein [Brevibacillus laterosporus]|uniref:Glycolipid-binding domain-containing protein n=1 Tax=Brevibacillus laterosporus TaxID=1465 RepID=A0AAP8QC74_BRELA|nr:putative glycolipid-binding domain-containing protein [Brevibacillus laterosporus]PPA93559.1 hypothetical protein C4A77_17920 [Brevibacillus laterosporus]
MVTTTDIFWRPSIGSGYEHLQLSKDDQQITVDSLVIGKTEEQTIFRVQYQISLDTNWNVRKVTIQCVGQEPSLILSSNGNGEWRDTQGKVISTLDGCIDIDISCTPFTNTLPINRLVYAPSKQQEISVVYISVPDLCYRRVKQSYTLIETNINESIFTYQSGSFTENIKVGADGIVTEYPQLFLRE